MNSLRFTVALALVALLGSTGCNRAARNLNYTPMLLPITEADIGYVELAGRYNHNVRYFDQIWVRDDIKVEWNETLASGKRRYRSESGDGKFMFNPPRNTVLTVEKLGKVYLWAGSNQDRYWLFDLVESGNEAVYVGSYAALGTPGTRTLPIPVRPDSVPYLLGLLALPVNPDAADQPEVQLYNGQYFVELPSLNLRMLIDPDSFRPTRIDLTDRMGFSLITSILEGAIDVEVEGLSMSDRPTICETAMIYVDGYDTRLTLDINRATTDSMKINPRVFDFERLMKQHKPQVYIDLDGGQ